MAEKTRDRDNELKELKEQVEKIVGQDELVRIKNIVDISYQLDENIEYKISYNVIGGEKNAIKK